MINHVFRYEVQGETEQLFSNCCSLSSFLDNLRQSKFSCEHGFQSLIESIITYKELLSNFVLVPTKTAETRYVHGSGINEEGNVAAVGVLYTTDEDNPLTASKNHVTYFLDNAQQHYGISINPPPNILHLFSNGSSLHERTIEQFIDMQGLSQGVVLYMKDDIAALVDGDDEFWEFFKLRLRCEEGPISQKIPRPFQKKAVRSCKGKRKGQIILPTGTGKTLIEAGIIEATIKSHKKSTPPVCVISSPRIILTFQHIDEISEYLLSRNIEAEYINLNSGDFDEDRIKRVMMQQGMITRDIPSTTDPAVLGRKYAECCRLGVPLVIGATFHSFPKLGSASLPMLALKIADEAHNLVMGRFANLAKEGYHEVSAQQSIFVTATPALTPTDEENPDVGRGMQNTRLFGKVLFTRSPKEMIDAGEIVPPYIHRVIIDAGTIKKHNRTIKIDDCTNIANPEIDDIVIVESFEELKKTHCKYSSDPEKMGAKMLVVFKGESEFVHFFTSNLVKKWATKNNVHLVGMTSHSGTYIIDGEGEDQHFRINENYKDEFRLHVDESSESRIKRQMIIGHIDMIAEGINIPSLLAILPLRDLGEIKAAHTMGRAMRLLVIDRRNFYAGKIKLKEIKQGKKMIKPYAWVIIPLYSWQHEDSHNRLVNMARRMKNELGYNPVETVPGGECGSGRIEGFRKDSHQLSSEVDSLDIVHEVDNPEFEARKEYEKNRMRKDPKAFRKMIKYTASG